MWLLGQEAGAKYNGYTWMVDREVIFIFFFILLCIFQIIYNKFTKEQIILISPFISLYVTFIVKIPTFPTALV